MKNKKYTFYEFVAAIEAEDFDNPSSDDFKWSEQFVNSFSEIMKTDYHFGDCTNAPCTCTICIYKTLLMDYEEYYFNEEKWREENEH
jgi:hypothetical protein